MRIRKKYVPSLRQRKGLLIIITAALLLELLSGGQWWFTHRLIEGELEKRAEGELTLKAILIKSNLNEAEGILNHHVGMIEEVLDNGEGMNRVVKQMVSFGKNIAGAGIVLGPHYYGNGDKQFEIYARRSVDGEVEPVQITYVDSCHDSAKHASTMALAAPRIDVADDHRRRWFYDEALKAQEGFWVDPYYDEKGAGGVITSFVRPIRREGNAVGVTCVDIMLEWLTDTIERRHIYPSSFLLLLTEGGIPVIRPSKDRVSEETTEWIMGLINDSTVVREKSGSGRSTVIHFDREDRDGTVFYANMKGKPHWQIAVVCYDDEVYASLSKLRMLMLLLGGVAFGVLLFVVWRFAQDEKKLQQKTLEGERIAGELRIASGIQRALLPGSEGTLVGIDSVEVEGRLIPAKAVGGDLYNVFVRDGKLFFCIGDVSGKGVPAAIIMAIVQTLFHNIALRQNNPAIIMKELNETCCQNNKSNMFITLFIGVLDLPTGRLRYCNAGHEVPILLSEELRAKDEERIGVLEKKEEQEYCVMIPTKANLPIGLFDDFGYKMQEAVMRPGDTLFLYTDGLTEAKSTHHELYGRERLKRILAAHGATEAKKLVEKVIGEVQGFAEGAEQSDDLTLLAISYTPKEEQLILDEMLTLPNDVKKVDALSTFIKDVMARLNIGKPMASKLRLALEEAVVNVMEYAYPAETEGDINIRVTSDEERLKFIITDRGVSFNPTEVAVADTTLSAEERPVGGLGILLVRELMDSINYERTNGKNVLTLVKELRRES